MTAHLAAIEAGGTKFRVAIADGTEIVADTTIPTTQPGETIGAALDFITGWGDVAAAGIAAFGPLDLDTASTTYGSITNTPKPGWSNTPLLSAVQARLGVPTAIDVDVGGAVLGESLWGAGQGADTIVYFTVGTGIGGGVLIDGTVHHGLGHPEIGHIPMRVIEGDDFAGNCPYHGTCLEGMAAGPALEARWGRPGAELAEDPRVWELEAGYLAQAIRTVTYVVAPQRVILGGGVLQQEGLLELVREKTAAEANGYVTTDALRGSLDDYIVAPAHGQDAGLIGAIALAMRARDTG